MYDGTDLAHNVIDTTSLNNVLGFLILFLLAKSSLVTMVEEYVHILLLISKYHAKAAGRFYFRFFFQYLDFCLKPYLQESQNQPQTQNPLT